MTSYTPMKITGMETGLVQSREEFILPNDAYPSLINAFVWRERIKRKVGSRLLGRLQRNIGTTDGAGNFNIILDPLPILEGISTFVIDTDVFQDPGGASPVNLVTNSSGTGTLDRATGQLTITGSLATTDVYFIPGLPVMGALLRELDDVSFEQTVFFDTRYAYIFIAGQFEEFIPGYSWHGTDYQFFWATNYWVTPNNHKLFWVTNFNINQATRDPIRYSAFEDDPTVWIDFAPRISNGDPTLKLLQCLALVPFRSRLVAFRTFEGTDLNNGIQHFQRIRWAAIGNPISDTSTLFPAPTDVNTQAWYDDVRGQGGFLDIPTSQAIISVGFVRDNLVIYCERSTWQLRYTGRSIAPFQIEKVNAELGAQATFSAIQFDTSLVGIGDKGIVQCDSFKSERIDIKIPDLVFNFTDDNNSNNRVYGIRDFQQRLAYWTYPDFNAGNTPDAPRYPNRRLVYNYENDSWAIFQDSITVFGPFQEQQALKWEDLTDITWEQVQYTWIGKPPLFPYISAGNQQGFVSIIDQQTSSNPTLFISNITGNDPTVTVITSYNHNLIDTEISSQAIKITGILGSDFSDINDGIYGVVVIDENNFEIYTYNSDTQEFTDPVINAAGTYEGGGLIRIRDGFSIKSKKFNFIDEGQSIQLGFVDVLMNSTERGEITLNVYADYNDENPVNTYPDNADDSTDIPDAFFNVTIPTSPVRRASSKNWQRVYCATRSSFITLEYTLSNAQLNSEAQGSDVQIDAQILWTRRAGRQLPIGV